MPESCGGLGAHPVDLVVACEELGHHPLPGPVAESVAAVPQLLRPPLPDLAGGRCPASSWLAALASGELIATLARPPLLPYALDADVAGLVLLADAESVWQARPGVRLKSADPARRLFGLSPDQALAAGPAAAAAVSRAVGYGTLASAALLLGAGRGLLEASTRHAKTRAAVRPAGRSVPGGQARARRRADRPGVRQAAALRGRRSRWAAGQPPTAARDISAARVACADAARRAARTALQVHGAIGYTLECDVSLWLAKVRSLSSTWGSQAEHRAVVLAALAQDRTGAWS